MATSIASTNFDYSTLNPTQSTASTATGNSATEIQNRFLTLLTTQLRAQDPMNPMDNSQMTSQMAQISTVSGLEGVNASIKAMTESQAASQSLLATMLIGRQVLSPSNTLSMADGKAVGTIEFAKAADKAIVTVTNSNGAVVDTFDMGAQKAGQFVFNWDGKGADGTTLPNGEYTFKVEASAGGTAVQATMMAPSKVTSVAWEKGVPMFVISSGQRVPVSQISQIL
ncbi:MAG: flagellar hook assembly protein FlgD [Vogesella sp.]|uniref:flagellar hook assembly protein FlgD n=1 Tax=Vogesella sp. TaxID=1904252 RepID=UPI003918D987